MTYNIHFFFILLCLPCLLNQTVDDMGDTTGARCNYTLVAPKKIINPYKSDIKNFVPQKPFGSFYLKCAACLAVAYQIGSIIDDILTQPETNQICQNSTNQEISTKINTLCMQGFKNYDLRKCHDYNIVTDKFRCTQHVNSNMDGSWTRKLREMCTLFTSYMDLDHISNIYANSTRELSTHLCKGSGIFRDCQNLEGDPAKNYTDTCGTCRC